MSSRKNFLLSPYIIAPKYSDISKVKCKCSNDIVLEKTYNFCPNCGKEIKKTNEISYGYLLNDEKARRVKEIKKELEYLDYELHEKSSEYDKLKKEFNNIEIEARNKKLKDNE